MDATWRGRGLSLGKLVLLAVLAGVAWCALSLFASSSSASASDNPENGSGLLGAVSQTVSGVGETLSEVTGSVEPVVSTVVTTVAPAVEPLPAPAAAPVQQAVETVQATTAAVDTSTVAVVDATAGAVADVAASGPLEAAVEPAVGLAENVPVVGDVLELTGLDTALTDTAGRFDAAVAAVVGDPGPGVGSIVPALPLDGVEELAGSIDGPHLPVVPELALPLDLVAEAPSLGTPDAATPSDALSAGRTAVTSTAVGVRSATLEGTGLPSGAATSADGDSESSRDGLPGGSLGIAGSTGAGNGAPAGSAAAVAHEGSQRSIYAFTTVRSSIDDALPGAPVFDSDVSPD